MKLKFGIIFLILLTTFSFKLSSQTTSNSKLIKPEYLTIGDTVAIVAPSGVLKNYDNYINKAKELLNYWGLNVVLGQNGTVVFEGSTDDTNETTLTVADPQQDNTVTIPDVTGFFAMFAADPSTTTVAATPAELNIMDGGTAAISTTLVDADRLVVNDDGTMKQVALSDVKTYISSAGFSSDDPTALAIALG